MTALPALNSDRSKGDTVLSITAHGLSVNDRICIYNPTDYSWHGSRPVYRAGEWCTIAEIRDANTVELFGSLYDDYLAADVDLYKHPNKKFWIGGGTLTILESTSLNSTAGFRADRIVDSDFSAIRPTNSGNAGMTLNQCIGITGTGYKVNQHRYGGGGTYYGVVFANCQDCEIHGKFYAGRHAVAGGGFGIVGAVPCRNIRAYGYFANSADAAGGVGAINMHGNCEHFYFEGLIDGGVQLGGDHGVVRGTIRAKTGQNGVAIYFGELKGCSFDFEGCKIQSEEDPNTVAHGVFDIGGNSIGALDANTQRGGWINLDNVTFEAPKAARLIKIRNRGYVGSEPIFVSVRGAVWPSTTAGSPVVFSMTAVSGNAIDELWLSDFKNGPNAVYSLDAGTKVKGWRAAGTVTLTPATTDSVVSSAVTINAPKAPKVLLGLEDANIGGDRVVPYCPSKSASSITVGAATADQGLFANTNSGEVDWLAVVDE